MKIVDPMPFMGKSSGMKSLVVTRQERAILLRAVAILEAGHALLDDRDPNHQGDGDDISAALCTAPDAIRQLATVGLALPFVEGDETIGQVLR